MKIVTESRKKILLMFFLFSSFSLFSLDEGYDQGKMEVQREDDVVLEVESEDGLVDVKEDNIELSESEKTEEEAKFEISEVGIFNFEEDSSMKEVVEGNEESKEVVEAKLEIEGAGTFNLEKDSSMKEAVEDNEESKEVDKAEGAGTFNFEEDSSMKEAVEGNEESKEVDEVKENKKFFEKYFFVGFAELYSGMNKNNGDTEILEDATEYKEHYNKGRVNLYLKGKVKGKYLLTVWMDTDENELKNMFNGLTDRDINTIFEKINPEEYYPIYGDNSSRKKDVASSGKLYIALESENFKFLWGNYKVAFNENELISFNKKLYGLNSSYEGEKISYDAFLYTPYSLSSMDVIKSTGGMLYYLKHGDLIIDSETIKVELRDSTVDRVLNTITLTRDEDYEISYTSGRLILKNNIDAYFNNSLIESANGYDTYYLVVDYEYEPSSYDNKNTSYGLEADYKLNTENTLTFDYIKNTQSDEDYEIYALDWTFKSNSTMLKTGYALSKNELSDGFLSDDGGLNYTEYSILNSAEDAEGWSFELERKIGEEKGIKAYYTYKEKGFSGGSEITDEDKTNYGVELGGKIGDVDASLAYDKKIREEEEVNLYTLAASEKYTEKMTLKSEVNYEEDIHKTSNDDKENSLEAAIGFSYMLKENHELYGSQQLTIDNSEDDNNNLTKLGTNLSYDKWKVNAEVGSGNKEDMLKIKTAYMLNDKSEIYTGIQRTFDKEDGIETKNIVGTKASLNEKTDIYTEYQVGDSEKEKTKSNLVGVDYIPSEKWLLSMDYTKSNVDENAGGNKDRDIITAGIGYKGERLKEKLKAEYRKDEGNSPLIQRIFTIDAKWKQNDEISYVAEADYDRTVEAGEESKKYIKGAVGLAYRPIFDDRLNTLAKYTYYENIDSDTNEDEYQGEKAHVFAVEGIYDITSKWQLGQKIGYKRAEVKLDLEDAIWFDSNTWMYIAKLNYKMNGGIDICGEYKYLKNDLAQDKKDGILLGVYKRFENNLKMGAGYNFAEFNYDLTNLDYKSKGVFINIVKAW